MNAVDAARFNPGSARASRAHCGASPQCFEKKKVRDGEGAIASTRGRVRSPEEDAALNTYPTRHGQSQFLTSKHIKYENEKRHPNCR